VTNSPDFSDLWHIAAIKSQEFWHLVSVPPFATLLGKVHIL
jgi:hypothetical protein